MLFSKCLFLAVLGLHCCSGFSLVAASGGHSLAMVHGFLVVVDNEKKNLNWGFFPKKWFITRDKFYFYCPIYMASKHPITNIFSCLYHPVNDPPVLGSSRPLRNSSVQDDMYTSSYLSQTLSGMWGPLTYKIKFDFSPVNLSVNLIFRAARSPGRVEKISLPLQPHFKY